MPSKPLIGIPACRRTIGAHVFHLVGEKYIAAVEEGAGATPLMLPSIGSRLDLEEVLARVDALLFTGSLSNVEPHHYGGSPSIPGTLHDPERDATTLPLIRMAVRDGVPLFAICRGIQELNVALGGTLHQRLWEVPGRFDHRSDKSKPPLQRYEPSHPVTLRMGGPIARLAGTGEIMVNSLHAQAIDRLAPALQAEAHAADGTIEAVSVKSARAFALGVQWHAEWKATEAPLSVALFKAFGDACRARARARSAPTRVA